MSKSNNNKFFAAAKRTLLCFKTAIQLICLLAEYKNLLVLSFKFQILQVLSSEADIILLSFIYFTSQIIDLCPSKTYKHSFLFISHTFNLESCPPDITFPFGSLVKQFILPFISFDKIETSFEDKSNIFISPFPPKIIRLESYANIALNSPIIDIDRRHTGYLLLSSIISKIYI